MDNSLSKEKDSKLEEYYQSIPSEIKNKIDIQMRNSICEIEYNESKMDFYVKFHIQIFLNYFLF